MENLLSGAFTRRDLLALSGTVALVATAKSFFPSSAWAETSRALASREDSVVITNIDINRAAFEVDGRVATAITMNGSVPGPLIRLKEGSEAILRVTNHLPEVTSIHWHGLILPPEMDGVPGVSFGGIPPGETFTYRFPVRQSGTYWCHSHSGGQELLGLYAPLIIDPLEREPFSYNRDYVVLLSDWSFESPERIIDNLKKVAGYYNYQRLTVGDFAHDTRTNGLFASAKEWLEWTRMRMDPTDLADVTGATYTYLMNGQTSSSNWTGMFNPGEKVRLRFIDAGAMTYFDVRIPGVEMTVVQADGQNVRPVKVDEFRIGPGETFDVIVEPKDGAHTIFAETADRSGYVRGTLAVHTGMTASIPERRPRPRLTMADMGMMDMAAAQPGMKMQGSEKAMSPDGAMNSISGTSSEVKHGDHQSMSGMSGMGDVTMKGTQAGLQGESLPGSPPRPHGPDTHGVGNSVVPMQVGSRLDEPGAGLGDTNTRVLVYADLRSLTPQRDKRTPAREVELHLTGNMERYMWSFDGKKYSEAKTPIPFRYGERLRLILVNDTMMEHPIHLHGMFMELENGAEGYLPRKHTISVKPAERLTVAITADARGKWALHCHLLLHMETGMFRVVEVSNSSEGAQ